MGDEACDIEDLCFDAIDGEWTGVLVEIVAAAYAFVGIAAVADEHLTSSLETLCHRWRIPEDVAGASFLALGSAAPEIIVAAVSTVKSILASQDGKAGAASFAQSLGISSVLGSGMLAFTLIPALCAMVVPRPMRLKRRPLARDAVAYGVSLIFIHVVVSKSQVSLYDATAMLTLYLVYLLGLSFAPMIRESYRVRVSGLPPRFSRGWSEASSVSREASSGRETSESDHSSNPMERGGAQASREAEEALTQGAKDDDDDEEEEEAGPVMTVLAWPFRPMLWLLRATCPECAVGGEGERRYPITLLVSFWWLAVFSTVLSAAVTRWGTLLHVPATAMGTYVIAVGAQIPDTIQAVAVARRGHGSMAVASAVGSQVINILIGLGMPWCISTSANLPVEIAPESCNELLTLVWVMCGCLLTYLLVLLLPSLPSWGSFGYATLGRREGWLLFAAYLAAVAAHVYSTLFLL